MCCSAQPPQVPKWRQAGGTRSALGSTTSTRCARVPVALDLDGLAGQREGHEDALAVDLGDAVAGMAELGDRHRLSHGGRRAGIRGCRRRLRSATG